MKTASKVTGFTLASAAAALVLAGCSTGGDTAKSASMSKSKQVADVKCGGVNSCKGTSACATATSACKGQNACKGQGWLKKSSTECNALGGEVLGQA